MRSEPFQERKRWRRWLPVLCLLCLAALTIAQTPVPPSPTPSPTEPPVGIGIQATPTPQPTPVGNIWEVVWEEHKTDILLGFIAVVISSILVGVFLRPAAEAVVGWIGKGLNWLARTFTEWTFSRRRLWREYVAVLDEETRKWQSLHGKPLDLDRVYIQVQVTRAPAILSRADRGREDWQEAWARRRRERKMEPRQALIQFRRLAAVGEPGVGKTTLLRYLAYI